MKVTARSIWAGMPHIYDHIWNDHAWLYRTPFEVLYNFLHRHIWTYMSVYDYRWIRKLFPTVLRTENQLNIYLRQWKCLFEFNETLHWTTIRKVYRVQIKIYLKIVLFGCLLLFSCVVLLCLNFSFVYVLLKMCFIMLYINDFLYYCVILTRVIQTFHQANTFSWFKLNFNWFNRDFKWNLGVYA